MTDAETPLSFVDGLSPFDEMRYLLGKTTIIKDFNLPLFLMNKNFTVASALIGGIDIVYFLAPNVDNQPSLPFPRQARFIGSTKGGVANPDHVIIVPEEIDAELQPVHAYREWIKAEIMETKGPEILEELIDLEAEVERVVLSAVQDDRLAASYATQRTIDTNARIEYLDTLMMAALNEGNQDIGEMFKLDFVKDQLNSTQMVLLGSLSEIQSLQKLREANSMQFAA